ncbi:TetR/AcrR family transcriptional regulator [Pseudonocardia phyllosphaerae]|uniref:TetR/AcrR family transcriptional regulator n=1 Tax=Pseudonocardia phyllosphaerae TaxID=3390502 RepID=UPI00397BAED8
MEKAAAERLPARERNRRSILDAAQDVLRGDPEASLDDVAARAGVVRRTVYGHFPSRQALVVELVRAATAEFLERTGPVDPEPVDPAAELAAKVLRTWSVSRRYGALIVLARQTADDEIRAAMAPYARLLTRLIDHGQRACVFTRHADAATLTEVLHSGAAAYLHAAQAGTWDGDEHDVALGHLLTLGVPVDDARAAVERAER